MMKQKLTLSIIALSACFFLNFQLESQTLNEGTFKIGRTLGLIDAFYVDTVNIDKLAETAIIDMLKSLDPHSVYIPADEVKAMNEPLNGNFEGVGIQFNILKDTILVVSPVTGGPSEKAGILAGDRIITIAGEKMTGIKISTTGVRDRLMGPKGTKVNIVIYRKGVNELLDFTITRDKIPVNSIDAAYMLDKETGYIKLIRFSATSEQEFTDAITVLKKSNMKNIIIDIRNNGGGYMNAAVKIADQFFTDQRLLVYLEGRRTPRQEFKSTVTASLGDSRVILLTDEGSASASEILAGAIQDWDRGIILGRRTFGKGLVQNAFYLTDGSMVRLTIARYYTPAGRSIQSPYNEGYDKYMENFYKRYSDGEMTSADRFQFPDSLKSKTLVNKRTVYSGGGIMPDVFVSADTSSYSDYYRELVGKGIINRFTLEYGDKNRDRLNSNYKTFEQFSRDFSFSPADIDNLKKMGEEAGIKFNESQYKISENEIESIMKGLVARDLWEMNEYYRIVNADDIVINSALKIITDKNGYNKILGY
jgi:carboxyl-terminal processing protease